MTEIHVSLSELVSSTKHPRQVVVDHLKAQGYEVPLSMKVRYPALGLYSENMFSRLMDELMERNGIEKWVQEGRDDGGLTLTLHKA